MIDYIIMSKALLPLARYFGAVMDAPWGPHFGLTLTMYGKPSEILLRMLFKLKLSEKLFEVLKPEVQAKAKGETDKMSSQQEREKAVARSIVDQADNANTWCNNFLNTCYEKTSLDTYDHAQAAIGSNQELLQHHEHTN